MKKGILHIEQFIWKISYKVEKEELFSSRYRENKKQQMNEIGENLLTKEQFFVGDVDKLTVDQH